MIEYRRSIERKYASSNRVAVSGLLYSSGNLLVLLPGILLITGLVAQINEASFFWTFFGLQMVIFQPLQGLFNALVYFRPQCLEYKKEREKHPKLQKLQVQLHPENTLLFYSFL